MQTIHLIVETGPEKGRAISIPPDGARVGRSSSNDIVLNDASLSRFHCRFYFKDRRHLHVADLASTNETLVNDRAVQDVPLAVGDRVAIGETTMKVVSIVPEGVAPEAVAEMASPGAEADSGERAGAEPHRPPPSAAEIDLGLHPRPMIPVRRVERRRSSVLGGVLLVAVLAVVGAAAWQFLGHSGGGGGPAAATGNETVALEIEYEKVEASVRNIFRYHLTLRDGVLAIRIDNLEDGRHLGREKRLDPKVLRELAQRLHSTDFFELNPEYSGLSSGVWETMDLTVAMNRQVHRTRVINRVEPPAFRDARVLIEEFGQNELGIFAVALPRERLMEMAQEAWLQGRKLFDEREVRNDNLARAIKRFTEVETLLEVIEPKPELYAEAIRAREECARLLQERYEDCLFRAERAIRLKEWREANEQLLAILDMIQDRDDERYQAAYKKLLYVQGKLRTR
jgi:hypothetical protein